MHEIAAEQKTEISFKMRLRAAWLAGDTPQRRSEIFKLVQRLYDLRSQAVHSGSLQVKKGGATHPEIAEILGEADALCVTLIEKLALEGWPDWNQIVLGSELGGSATSI